MELSKHWAAHWIYAHGGVICIDTETGDTGGVKENVQDYV